MKADLTIFSAVVGIIVSLPGKAAELSSSNQPNPVILWNNAALKALKETRSSDVVTSRVLAIVYTGIFDAWAAYDSQAAGTQLGDSLRYFSGTETLGLIFPLHLDRVS